MLRTPPYLKGLAETRARASADYFRHQGLISHLDGVIPKLKQSLDKATLQLARSRDGLVHASHELDACDRLIKKAYAWVNPSLILPVNTTGSRYGFKGGLKEGIVECLQAAAPSVVSLRQLGAAMTIRFNLEFPSKEKERRWRALSLVPQLKLLREEGLVEHRQRLGWRWKKQQATTMDELRAMAAAAGVGTVEADDVPDGPPEGAAEEVDA